ncbi:protein-disulfide reductase DsbD N-terminal domain-containing protein [Burkholderia cenocepacia]|uniref:Protein-disulfide reductase DsbD N-terminal domain-containing protein n=1 Tax=Burkholderia cenocepacia TaxID=95486 RepID=A0ABD4UFA3_9BURK|nr:protein-disulfide reductase DsbD N-terminal domain-containing protein [Burkholderia cenocepacia]MCW3696684.1 protein-disulfide reductase DsbD N-terminal domain-containing protein [Burkholderia cenocepacia]MCW3713160.1 protein-disulfide reductase DsbD N-terminal domain-containing protein [Burkholderia cenocepacia]MCW3721903.1 protein-disulfide reductase DsbD N-terminal domain-containing protein [Burkholderia cenocepacia]MCW3729152.1 protein-disulfide reductase DsbD N-terminal domain-containin
MMTARTRVLRRVGVAVSLALLAWILSGVLACPAHAEQFLSPEQAFRVRMTEEPGTVVLHFAIADGYRLYGDRFRVASDDGRAHLGAIQHGTGKVVADLSAGHPVEVFEREVTLRVPVKAREMFGLTVTYQGCAINQICYPPMQRTFPVIAAALLSPSEASR